MIFHKMSPRTHHNYLYQLRLFCNLSLSQITVTNLVQRKKKWFEKEEPKIVLKQFHWRGVLNRGLTLGSAMTNFKHSNRDR